MVCCRRFLLAILITLTLPSNITSKVPTRKRGWCTITLSYDGGRDYSNLRFPSLSHFSCLADPVFLGFLSPAFSIRFCRTLLKDVKATRIFYLCGCFTDSITTDCGIIKTFRRAGYFRNPFLVGFGSTSLETSSLFWHSASK